MLSTGFLAEAHLSLLHLTQAISREVTEPSISVTGALTLETVDNRETWMRIIAQTARFHAECNSPRQFKQTEGGIRDGKSVCLSLFNSAEDNEGPCKVHSIAQTLLSLRYTALHSATVGRYIN